MRVARPGVALRQAAALVLLATAVACGGSPSQPTPTPDAPTISCPGNLTASSTNGHSADVTFVMPTTQNGSPPVSVACAPGSGSTFDIGTTTVACTATDATSRTASCSFDVSVTAPAKLSAVKFMAFGDSMTQGVTSLIPTMLAYNPNDAYPLKLEGLLAARYTAQVTQVINEGAAGEQADGTGKRRFGTVLNADNPDVVLLLEGANDLNHYLIATGDSDGGVTPAARALEEMIDTARKKGVPVLLATLPPQDPEGNNGHSAGSVPKLNDAIRRLANGDEVVIVDLFNGLGGVPDGNIGADGLHPTPAGYDRIAQVWFDAIQHHYEEPGTAPTLSLRKPH
jgi:lysophospholipase L1-like esterase